LPSTASIGTLMPATSSRVSACAFLECPVVGEIAEQQQHVWTGVLDRLQDGA
jgi:hypothetical protein